MLRCRCEPYDRRTRCTPCGTAAKTFPSAPKTAGLRRAVWDKTVSRDLYLRHPSVRFCGSYDHLPRISWSHARLSFQKQWRSTAPTRALEAYSVNRWKNCMWMKIRQPNLVATESLSKTKSCAPCMRTKREGKRQHPRKKEKKEISKVREAVALKSGRAWKPSFPKNVVNVVQGGALSTSSGRKDGAALLCLTTDDPENAA